MENGLLDNGFSFDKVDSSLQTIKTDYKTGSKWKNVVYMRYYVRIKDGDAIL